jgi:hypothetical protein
MAVIFEKFKKRMPRFSPEYQDNIIDRFSRKFGGSEKDKVEKGKFFSNNYECYLYATMLGLRRNYRVPFDRREGKDFSWALENWKPIPLVDYMIMALIAKSDWDLLEIERLSEQEQDAKVSELIILMEEYTNGGFDILKGKMSEEPHYFENEFAMVKFLKE